MGSNHTLMQVAAIKNDTISLCHLFLERMRGIEPPTAAWEAAVLPLNYIRTSCGQVFVRIPIVNFTSLIVQRCRKLRNHRWCGNVFYHSVLP